MLERKLKLYFCSLENKRNTSKKCSEELRDYSKKLLLLLSLLLGLVVLQLEHKVHVLIFLHFVSDYKVDD
jgi:hypothetical protein